jgi:RNA polymerase sigma-B factor
MGLGAAFGAAGEVQMQDRATRAQFEEYRRTGDLALRNELVEAHLHLAAYHARRYSTRGLPREDLHQVSLMAIISAVERYDPSLGTSFRTFASRTIEGECKRFIRDRTWAVRPPRAVQELHLRVAREQEELSHELGRPPTAGELAGSLHCTVEQVLEAIEAGSARTGLSLDGPAPGTRAESAAPSLRTLGDALGSVDARFDLVEDRQLAASFVTSLSPRDRHIVYLRFVQGETESRIAQQLGVSQSYLSRVLHRILAQLRAALDDTFPRGTSAAAGGAE